ncbi:MAG: murein L,D-transpeptidase catalytic domain family protein [Bacteroidetes bacterium]|nr:murein L,D-transpeptidase catalytic domain family protein [Bacteroidota bacterium]
MKRLVLCCVAIVLALTVNFTAKADDVFEASPIKKQIAAIYSSIDFGKDNQLAFEVFQQAYIGYANLNDEGKLNENKRILTICDMSLSANIKRMWIIDLDARKVLLNTYVAHGQGSGEEFATKFSNKMNSHQTSIGFYVTGSTYNGEHGNSLYLHGMDKGYNHLAYERSIVVHGADYVNPGFICSNDRLGRSWGCPAVSDKLSDKVINYIKDSTCLYVYFPQANYLKSSYWLNKKIGSIPDNMFAISKPGKVKKQKTAEIVYEYGPTTIKIMKAVAIVKLPLM